MMIAKRESVDNKFIIGNYWELFPETSFPADGPNADWFIENQCYQVNLSVPFDPDTQELREVEPYLENGWVYRHQAFDKN